MAGIEWAQLHSSGLDDRTDTLRYKCCWQVSCLYFQFSYITVKDTSLQGCYIISTGK